MNEHQLNEEIDNLVIQGQHDKAEEILMREYEGAKFSADVLVLDTILGQLVFVLSARNPPNLNNARRFCFEREKNVNSAYNMLQTAMFLYHTANDYQGAVTKLREAIAKGREDGDNRSVYSALGLLGRALLELRRFSEAASVMGEIEEMLLTKKPFVVGDETVFLEDALNLGVEVESARRIAVALAPLCRDPEFTRRLKILAGK